MEYKFIIYGSLPGLNQYQYACRSHFSKGNDMKRTSIMIVSAYIFQQLKDVHISKRVKIEFHWYEPNKKRDLDNISSFGRKVIQDALVDCGVLKNDGWKNISGFTDMFFVDSQNPRIEVILKEEEEEEEEDENENKKSSKNKNKKKEEPR